MENSKMIKTAKVADKILKIAQGFMIAFIIVAAIFSVLTAILGEKIIADASTLNLGNIALTYDKTFALHHINALALAEAERDTYSGFFTTTTNFNNNAVGIDNNLAAT